MNKVALVLVLALGGGFAYWLWSSRPSTKSAPPPKIDVAAPAIVADARVEPRIQHPLEGEERSTKPLPGLDDSDAALRDRMASLFGTKVKKLAEIFFLEGIVRRIVATVDSLPREQVALAVWPVKPMPGEFIVDKDPSGPILSPKNTDRYATRVRLGDSVDPKKLATAYRHFYPLFQKAYQDLGYPQGYFNDRLVEVIDHLLATPEPPQPIRLVQTGTRYQFADADLQRRSAGQKILLRIGPGNAMRMKEMLRAFRQEITR
jgi:hypothetical protein